MRCHPVYNDDGIVKGHERRGRLGFSRSAISLWLKVQTLPADQGSCSSESLDRAQLHHPSMRSPAGGDHDSWFGLPNCAGRQSAHSNARAALGGAHGMTRAALHTSWPVGLLRLQHPVQPHRQFARHHHFADAGVLFLAAQALIGSP